MMDNLIEAKESLQTSSTVMPFEENPQTYALQAIGYALIAIAEQLQRVNEREEKEAEIEYSNALYKSGM